MKLTNRQIKFRAWDVQHKTMIYESRQDEYDDYYMINLQGDFFPHTRTGDAYFNPDSEYNDWYKGEYILMQFTGLTDCKGKEVYEGDIVGITDTFHTYHKSVKWHIDHWTLDEGGEWGTLSEWVSGNVIGNIYENPELLNQ